MEAWTSGEGTGLLNRQVTKVASRVRISSLPPSITSHDSMIKVREGDYRSEASLKREVEIIQSDARKVSKSIRHDPETVRTYLSTKLTNLRILLHNRATIN